MDLAVGVAGVYSGLVTTDALPLPATPTGPPAVLRPYQAEACEAVRAAWAEGVRRVLVVMPTGAGKTVVAATLIAERVERGERCLVLAHRGELCDQAERTIARHLPASAGIGRVQGSRRDYGADVVVSTAQTMWRAKRRDELLSTGRFGLVWLDEAHLWPTAQSREMLAELGCWAEGGPDTLGVTATPDRLDKIDMGHIMERLAYTAELGDMIADGYLVPPRARQVSCDMDLSRVRTVAGDYVAADLEAEMLRSHVAESIVDAWQTFGAGRKRTLVFVPLVRIARTVAEAFVGRGIAAEWVAGIDPPAERAAKLGRHRSGETKVLINALLLSLGYDDPEIDTVIWARPTQSRSLFQQAVGRGLRPWPLKTECEIIDLIGTTSRHRLVGVSDIYPPGAVEAAKLFLAQILAPPGRRRTAAEVARLGEACALSRAALNLAAKELGVRSVVTGGVRWVSLPVGGDKGACEPGESRPREDPTLLSGTITSVDIVEGRSAFAWRQVGDGWVLPGGVRLVPTRPDDAGRTWWAVLADDEVLASGLDLGWAMGTAEDHVRRSGLDVLAAADAPWRSREPTDKQVAILCRWGLDVPATRGEAADLITDHYGR